MAGYSRLMQDDEAATVTTLESYKQAFIDLIKQHRGRVVDSPGDNLLAEFASVVDAVQCAVAVQKELQARICVNMGDVIEEGERIYGDGVNIAVRLESLSDLGKELRSEAICATLSLNVTLIYRPLQQYQLEVDT